MRRFAFLAWAFMSAGVALADDGAPPAKSLTSLPAPAREALSWLPAKCEALFVTTGLTIRGISRENEPADEPAALLRALAVDGLDWLLAKDAPPCLEGKSADWTLHAARGFEVVSKFGAYRYEGCTIYGLGSLPAEDRRKFTQWLKEKATAIESFGQATVYRFPSQFIRDSVFEAATWEGWFVTWVNEETLVVATSDRYLRDLLARIALVSRERVIPAAVLDWRQVDPAAESWGVRWLAANPPEQAEDARTTLSATKAPNSQLHVAYEPATPAGRLGIDRLWLAPNGRPLETRAKLEEQNGAIQVTITRDDLGREVWYGFATAFSMCDGIDHFAKRIED